MCCDICNRDMTRFGKKSFPNVHLSNFRRILGNGLLSLSLRRKPRSSMHKNSSRNDEIPNDNETDRLIHCVSSNESFNEKDKCVMIWLSHDSNNYPPNSQKSVRDSPSCVIAKWLSCIKEMPKRSKL